MDGGDNDDERDEGDLDDGCDEAANAPFGRNPTNQCGIGITTRSSLVGVPTHRTTTLPVHESDFLPATTQRSSSAGITGCESDGLELVRLRDNNAASTSTCTGIKPSTNNNEEQLPSPPSPLLHEEENHWRLLNATHPGRGFTLPGAFAVDGYPQEEHHHQQQDEEDMQATIVAAHSIIRDTTTDTAGEHDEDAELLINHSTETTIWMSSNQQKKQWKRKLLLVLSLEVNVVLLAVIVVLLALFVVVCSRGEGGGSQGRPSGIGGVPMIQPEKDWVQTTQKPQEPISQLDRLNLPDYTKKAMENSRSPQSKAFQWLVQNNNNASNATTANTTSRQHTQSLPEWRLRQRFAMATIYFSMGGEHWVKQHGWLDWDTHECQWEYVLSQKEDNLDLHCDDLGQITSLAFELPNNLEGTVPPEISLLGKSIGSLALSRHLRLNGNLPTEIGLLTRLSRLSFYFASFDGAVPTEIGQLQMLEHIALSSHHMSGALPSELGRLSKLTNLFLSSTGLSGSFPSEIYQLASLNSISADDNPHLSTESILTGVIENMEQMEFLFLNNRTTSSKQSIPTTIGKLTEMKFLMLNNWHLHGTIPSEIGNLSNLEVLDLSANALSGSLPSSLFELYGLMGIDIHSNQLQRDLPPTLFAHLTNLMRLNIFDNQFSGTIPTEIGLLTILNGLWIQSTHLSGTLPSELLALDALTTLVIKNTSLSGSLPDELCDKLDELRSNCFGLASCLWKKVETNETVCQGTNVCGCDCVPCQGK